MNARQLLAKLIKECRYNLRFHHFNYKAYYNWEEERKKITTRIFIIENFLNLLIDQIKLLEPKK